MVMVQTMTIQEQIKKYISKLERNLKQLPKQEKEDIIREIESHIYESIGEDEADKTGNLDQVLKKLGEPKDYARLLISQHIAELAEKGSFSDNFNLFIRQMRFPFVITALTAIVLMLSNTFVLYAETIIKWDFTNFEIIKLFLFSLPAIIVVIIPMCVLFAVPMAFYSMIRALDKTIGLKSSKVWSMVLLVGVISSIISFGINEVVVPVANHQSVLLSRDIMSRNSIVPLTFSNKKSVQEMSYLEARKTINDYISNGYYTKKMSFDLYNKLSIPLACLACAIFGSFIGCLMLTEIFNKKYILATMGFIIPIFIWEFTYNSFYNQAETISPFTAFIPDLVIGGFGLIMILGVFLNPKPEKLSD
jgi:lipopolysaccharide export LptBFGC system permease protein LptF